MAPPLWLEPEMSAPSQFILRVPIIYTGADENFEVGNFFVKADTNQLLLECSDSNEKIYAILKNFCEKGDVSMKQYLKKEKDDVE